MQVRSFRMAPSLLYHVIARQAGSIEKAWLEAAMNSADARASRVDFKIDRYTTRIEDDGIGMTEDDVIKYFEVFGLEIGPEEKKTYAEFRMGRGQLFAQGKNVWRTGDNVLTVDIKGARASEVNYTLEKSPEPIKGTAIEVRHYEPLTTHEVQEKIRRFSRWVRYFDPTKVVVNEETTTKDMKTLFTGDGKYFFETETARYGIDDRSNEIWVYNTGAFVRTFWNMGVGGDVNSERRLRVNFARNDIMYNDPTWRKIQEELDNIRLGVLSKKVNAEKPLTDENRAGIINLMLTSDTAKQQFEDVRVFRTANEQLVSLQDLKSTAVSTAKLGDVLADKATDQTGAIFLDEGRQEGALDLLKKEGVGVIPYMDALGGLAFLAQEAAATLRDKILGRLDHNLTPLQKYNLGVARFFVKDTGCDRTVRAAMRTCTDGKSNIYVTYETLALSPFDFLATALDDLIHEETHDDDTVNTEIHGETFYERFYGNARIMGSARVRTILRVLSDPEAEKLSKLASKN